jgi:hypothetical protein
MAEAKKAAGSVEKHCESAVSPQLNISYLPRGASCSRMFKPTAAVSIHTLNCRTIRKPRFTLVKVGITRSRKDMSKCSRASVLKKTLM